MAENDKTRSPLVADRDLDVADAARLLTVVLGALLGLVVALSLVGDGAAGVRASAVSVALVAGLGVGTMAVYEAGYRAARWAE